MNPTGKKFISLLLVFSLMTLSVNLYAKERRGAKLKVTKLDGQLIEGELITVKPNSLLLLNTEGKDESVDIEDIEVIRIVKKSKVGRGVLIGLGIGGVVTLLRRAGTDELSLTIYWFVYGTTICVLLGGIIGAVVGTDKTIQIEGMTDSKIQKTLDYLRKKARVRDYK